MRSAIALLITAVLAGCHAHETGDESGHHDGDEQGLAQTDADSDQSHDQDHDQNPGHDQDAPMTATTEGIYALSTSTLAGQPADLSQYAGKVALVVNVASACGYTPQYAGLQELYESKQGDGLVVLGFPSNEFGGQEPGSAEEIAQFCSSNFGVTFPMFAKCETQPGTDQSPVYSELHEQSGDVPNWNFCKYLVGKDGNVIAYYPSKIAPDDAGLLKAIDAALDG